MSVGERDPHTGYMTTGHEWNGITELNRPVPRTIYFFLAVTVVFSLVYWILMPAWPAIESYSKGLLQTDQRERLADALAEAKNMRASWAGRVEGSSHDDILRDRSLMAVVRNAGQTLYDDNCLVCHGPGGNGGPGFPNLADDAWLWGSGGEAIDETLRVGINSDHEQSRISEMMGFGSQQILDRAAVLAVTDYVMSLSQPGLAGGAQDRPAAPSGGAAVYEQNCAACHGRDGTGNSDLGAPDLSDDFWIYGSDRQSVFTSVYAGRQGVMPHWERRLTPLERKILSVFILDLGAGER